MSTMIPQVSKSTILQPDSSRFSKTSRINSPARWRSAYIQFFIIQLVHITGFYFLEPGKPDAWLLMFSGLLNIFIYSKLLAADIRYGGDDINPFWFYLGMSVLRLGVGTIYVAAIIWTGDDWALRLGRIDATAWLMDGHLLLLIGDFCVIAGYFVVRKIHNRGGRRFKDHQGRLLVGTYRAGLAMALAGFGLRAVTSYISLGGLGQIVDYVADFGVPAGIFMMLSSCRNNYKGFGHPHTILAISLLVVSILSGLSSYMKTDLLISIFPVIFLVLTVGLRRLGNPTMPVKIHFRSVVLFSLIAYFFLLTVSTYSEIRRPKFWANMGRTQVIPTISDAPEIVSDLLTAALASVPGTNEFEQYQQYPDGGVWNMLMRLSATSSAATAMKLVEESGTREDSIISAILLSITPRILYPDKPQISWGREVAVVLGQARSVETARTATSLSMPGFLYWWGGYASVILMTFLSGAGFAFVFSIFAKDWRVNPVSTLVIMALAYNGFHWKESDVLGGFPFYLYMLIVFLPLARLVGKKVLVNKRLNRASQR